MNDAAAPWGDIIFWAFAEMARIKKTTTEETPAAKTRKTAATPAKKAGTTKSKAPEKEPVTPISEPKPRRKTLFEEVQEEKATKPSARARKPAEKQAAEDKPQAAVEAAKPTRRTKAAAPVEKAETKTVAPKASSPKPARQQRKPATTRVGDEDHLGSMDALPVPKWRKSERAAVAPALQPEEAPSPDLAPRRSKTRKRKDRKGIEITAEAAVAPAPARTRERREHREQRPSRPEPVTRQETPMPETPVRQPVSIPDTAGQVALHNGLPTLFKDQKAIPPLFFFASAEDEGHLATVLEEARLASESGVHVFSFLVELEVDSERVSEAVAFAGYMIKQFSQVDPEAQFIVRTVIVAPPGWEQNYRKAAFIGEDGDLAEPSLCDEEFWADAENCLSEFVRKVRMLDKQRQVLGMHIERGEWFLAEATGYDTSEAAALKFRQWLQHRYRNDVVTLRAAWFDGNVDFASVGVPEYREMRQSGVGFVRTDRKARRWVDYHLFLSDAACERIVALAYAAKQASEGHFLVGVSYGYTFEWSHPASGHLSLGKLLRCPDIDYIGGPPSYKNREPGGAAPFPAPVDSFALNGKLYISEEDFKTPISGQREPDDFNPVMKTPQALGNVHWRGAGAALAHMAGTCWMDTWGNGWLNSRGIWNRAMAIQRSMSWRQAVKPVDPDVAVFVDERSLAYLVDKHAFENLVQNVRESVLRSGLSVGFYLLSDLAHRENFPECKLHVFVNAWDIRPEVRSAIKARLQKDGKVLLWLYCAGLFEGGRDSLERVREVTGIALRPQPFYSKPGTTILNWRDPLCANLPEQALSKGGQLDPSYFAIPEDGSVLGEYSQTGLPSYVVRKFSGEGSGSWHSVFLGEPVVTPGLFRSLAQLGGAHVWSFQNDVVHVKPPFLTIHCTGTGPRTIALPDKWHAYSVSEDEWAVTEGNSLRFQGLDGASHSFLVGTRAELEAIIAQDPQEVLREIRLEPRTDNTLHWDMINFEVPIMKLDEWVEESWSEELADDLLLKPSMLEVADENAIEEEPQRSRGRRRRRGRRGSEETARPRREGADRQADEMAINVMFRKRD
ncbi:MAG: hypothetical protein JSS66_02770 [Armatimonadetes bacterium]|nr:hypothetical protein [Armatimonadota bacterium]